MAKGDVVLKFDAQTAEFIQKVMAARSALDETAKKGRDVGDAFEKSGQKVDKFADKVSHGVLEFARLVALPTTIMGGIEMTLRAVEARIKLAEEKAKALNARDATFQAAMYSLGTNGQAAGIRQQIGGMAGTYGGLKFDGGNIESIFSQIVASVGPRASLEQHLAGTRTAIGAMAAGANVSQAVQAGSGMAAIQALIPGLGEDEADHMARLMQLNAPDVLQDEKILGAIATSKDKMGMARFFASGYQNFQGAKLIKPISDFVESRPWLSYEQVMENPLLLPPNERTTLQAIREGEGKLREVGTREQAIGASVGGRDDIAIANVLLKNAKAGRENVLDLNASEDTINQVIFQEAQNKLLAKSPEDFDATPDWLLRIQAGDPSSFAFRAFNFGSDVSRAPAQEARNEVLEELRRLREAAEQQTEVMRQKESSPLLGNGKEGQQ